MKAEQRKELETNTLADKMGRVVTRVKASPRRTFFMYAITFAIVIGGLFFLYRWWLKDKQDTSNRWANLYDGSGHAIQQMATQSPDTYAGKSARFQIAWILYWDRGVKMIGSEKAGKGALADIAQAGKWYADLANDCKGDPIFEPQALLGKAIVEETLAIQAPKRLDKAAEYYNEVVEKYDKSAEGIYAKERLDLLKDSKKRIEMQTTYADLQRLFSIDAAPQGLDPVDLADELKKAKALLKK